MLIPRIALVSALVGAVACGSTGHKSGFGDNSSGSSGAPSSSGGDPSLGGGSSSSSSGTAACAAEVSTAQRAIVDIVILIDTSGSMSEETAQVQQNINDFAKTIGTSGLDYQVIMIAQKPITFPFPIPGTGICVPAPLATANCNDNPPRFHHLNQTVDSTDSLQLILSTYDKWKTWIRGDAYKLFIEITDDNSSLDWQSFDTQLLAKDGAMFGDANKRKYIFDAICGWQDGTPVLSSQKCGSAVNTGDKYQHLAQLTSGTVDSVCKTSFAGVFSNLAKGLVTKLGCEFAVPKPSDGTAVDPAKVAVQYTPGSGGAQALTRVTDASKCASITDGWYFDNNDAPSKIVFCPELCSSAGTDTNGKVEVLAGCLAPPPK